MGKIPQGILGSLSGKVGSVIGGSWKGIDYIRIKPASVANPRTEGQVNQRNKFTVTLEFLQANKEFIKVGYKGFANKKTEFNAAMSYVLNNAVTGSAPNFVIDYSLALLSRGTLSGVLNGSTDLNIPGEVTFDWGDNSAEGNANTTDKAMVLVYNPSKKESIYILDGADRTVGSQTVTIPNTYVGDTVELFMAFVSADGNQVSNSIYLGSGTAN
ncbi:DUF6266 family protein [Mesonia sp. HuA40]|uniref:DUF6266 family protein n=1 Tax=Mesonia sp. HuA40 TaxID=2602761 RepID=UPI0011CB13D9|nr:DUF6266 family protein [Mesonia sp. HuA40]TXK74534.1 hypothetical protein FT993_01830 [Mesonia sp. HuA40]